ncbi:MAG: amidase [Dehalococcoidia bacterium]
MTADTELAFTPAGRLREMIGARELSPVELTELTLRRIETLNPRLNAFITVTGERAMDAAREAEAAVMRGDALGPLHGIPVPIKDLEAVKGVRLTQGSLIHADEVADSDALCVDRIRAAGGIVIGKTNTPEHGHSGTTENRVADPCRNPWDPERTPGGSSGGAAASVASGMTAIAQGSDGGGSVRIPCGFSGIFGIKATQGRVPRRHAGPNSWHIINHSSVGPMTRTVRDGVIMLQALAGPSPDAEYGTIQDAPPDFEASLGMGVRGLRVAFSPDMGGAAVDGEVAKAVAAAAEVFEDLGATVEQPEFKPDDYEALFETFYMYFCIRGYGSFGSELEHADMLTGYFRTNIEYGQAATAEDYVKALNNIGQYRAYVNDFMSRYDLLLTPSLAVPAFLIGQEPSEIGGRDIQWPRWGYTPFTYLFNLTGNPGASVPCGFSKDGLPIGLQVVGRLKDEETVLAASAAFEEARPWAGKRPPVS